MQNNVRRVGFISLFLVTIKRFVRAREEGGYVVMCLSASVAQMKVDDGRVPGSEERTIEHTTLHVSKRTR